MLTPLLSLHEWIPSIKVLDVTKHKLLRERERERSLSELFIYRENS